VKIKLNDQDARLLRALIGETYCGLNNVYEQLQNKLTARGYASDNKDPALEARLEDLVGARVFEVLR
jgi:hypothetical protein